LTAFESNADTTTRTSRLAFATSSRRFTVSATFATAHTLATVDGSFDI
jgi:hypothetical protein